MINLYCNRAYVSGGILPWQQETLLRLGRHVGTGKFWVCKTLIVHVT